MKNNKMNRFAAMGLALCTVLGMSGTALAYTTRDAIIDYDCTASLTITKYDLTAATQAGVSTGGLVSTGKENPEAETMLQDYTLGGVEFTYLRLGGIDIDEETLTKEEWEAILNGQTEG